MCRIDEVAQHVDALPVLYDSTSLRGEGLLSAHSAFNMYIHKRRAVVV
jgi:hypothetical protein